MSAHEPRTPRRARWTAYEVLLLSVSVIMIAFPALVTGYALVSPTGTSAAEAPFQRATQTPGASPTPTDTRTPTATPTDTSTPTPTATATSTATATATTEQSPTATTEQSPTATATTEPAVTVEPTPTPALAVRMRALSTTGATISTVRPGERFNYYIEVQYDEDDAAEVELRDELPNEVGSPDVQNVNGGACTIADGRVMECTLTPRSQQIATVLLQVTMGDIANSTPVTNTVTVRSLSNFENDEADVTVTVRGGSAPTATTQPTNAPTEAPTATTNAPTEAPTATTQPTDAPTGVPATNTPTIGVPATSVPSDAPEPTATSGGVGQPETPRPTRVPPRGDDDPPTSDAPDPTNPGELPVTVVPVATGEVPTATATDAVAVPVEPTAITPLPTAAVPSATVPTTPVPTATAPVVAPTEPPIAPPAPVDDVPVVEPAPVDDVPVVDRPVLERGMSGDAVIALQTLINAWIAQTGATGVTPLAVDGMFGPGTEMAVRTFQAVAGLAVDGVVGPQTWASLDAFGGAIPPDGSVPGAVPMPQPAGTDVPVVPPVAVPADPSVQPLPILLDPTPTFAPTLVPIGTPIAANAPGSNVALRFNVGSGVTEAAPGDLVMFTITLRHAGRGNGGSAPLASDQLTQPASGPGAQGETLRDIVLVDELSPALEVFAVNSVGIDVERNGRRIQATRNQLAPGEAAVIVIGTRVRDNIDLPTIANQASVSYSTLGGAIYSNITEVRVNGALQPIGTPVPAATATTPTTTAIATVTASPSTSAVATPPVAPSATPIVSGAAPADLGTQLPTTSGGGVPLGGIVLLALTLLLHGLRVRMR